MRIEGNAIGVINWRLRGKIGPVPIDADFESRYTLNVLTGRVEEHRCVSTAASMVWLTRCARRKRTIQYTMHTVLHSHVW